MRRHAWIVLAAGLLVAAEDKDAAKKDLKQLEGTWEVAAFEHNGKQLFKDESQNWTVEIKGDKYTFRLGNQTEEGTFRLDPSKKPRTVELNVETGAAKGQKRLGIYEVNGDDAKACFATVGTDERPSQFASEKDSQNWMWTFKRKKD